MGTAEGEVREFDVTATNACKGVALMLLLWFHLFYMHPEYGFLVHALAQPARVCVGMFLILSGYGLTESVRRRSTGLVAFYKKRLAKLYLNYWFIAALFVPIGMFYMGRTLASVYSDHPYLRFAVEMAGVGTKGGRYNGTWWFMTLIVGLYVFFPFIHDLTKKYGVWFLLFCFLLLFPSPVHIPVFEPWLFPFALGIFIAHRNGLVAASSLLRRTGPLRFVILACLIASAMVFRQHGFLLVGSRIDGFFGTLIILLVFETINSIKGLRHVLAFIGQHAFNIFLFHTFIYAHYWPKLIYCSRFPVVIFAVLLSVCLLVSVLIEQLKKLLGFEKLSKAIEGIKTRDRVTI